jgi:hypothetical protein
MPRRHDPEHAGDGGYCTSVGGEAGQVTDYKEIRGYVLARKPAMLRMIGLMPIVRNRAFDMVSDGKEFKLWIPPKNRFVIGRNDAETVNPKQPLESIRPQNLYEAILIREIDPQDEIAVLENGYETVLDSKRHLVEQPDYEIVVVKKGKQGWFLSRRLSSAGPTCSHTGSSSTTRMEDW